MKFSEMPYQRPDAEALASRLDKLAAQAADAKGGEALLAVFQELEDINNDVYSQENIGYIRHTIDTQDSFYDKENDFFDEFNPVYSNKLLSISRAMLANPHRDALAKRYGQILLDKMDLAVKGSDERVVALRQEDNALASRYDKLYASAKIPFDGKELTVAQLTPFKTHRDRAVRREAFVAEGSFFEAHREELDNIYDALVKNRTKQAELLGYENFCPVGDIRMERLGYGRKEVGLCRQGVVDGIVPVVQRLKARQARRIGVEDFSFHDDLLAFPEGNPTPKGTPEEILAGGQEMYRGLSPETAEFIDFMMDGDLFDVLSRPGKTFGGYCTSIPSYQAPFIFSNFNGTAGDVDVLTHEAGHAFAIYRAMRKDLPSALRSPGLESCEIHSMAMEFLTAGYHHLFFKEETEKYALYQACDALYFLPYGCLVDEFQETVYTQPGLTPAQRNQLWAELEKKYRPWIDFRDIPFYSRGAGWQRQTHIYRRPFYYIDYVLAQAVALEFFLANQENQADAWQRYLTLLEKAGTDTYMGLVHAAGLRTPFDEGAMPDVGQKVLAWIEQQPLY